jgi:outer membrane lipoprotein SlyB
MADSSTPGAVPTAPLRVNWLVGGALALVSLACVGAIALQTRAGPSAPAADAPVPPAKSAAAKAPAAVPAPEAAAACRDCGVVESVRSLTRKGEASGVGAVAGGVLGAVVGNQVGKGNGRTAMTAIGAVGGGLAGHEIEKRSKSVTVHEVRVRMDDGSLRTIEQAAPARAGDRVLVEGKTLKPAPAARS